MVLTVPSGKFSIGTSSTTATTAAPSFSVDMSLDDMIKSRRDKATQEKKGKAGKKATTVQKAVGRSKAKKAAATAARRGIASSSKPSPMEVQKEIYREQRKTRQSSSGQQQQGRKGLATSNRRSRRLADVKVKAKTQAEKKKAGGRGAVPARPPSKKAVKAAVSAMSQAGFTAPKGMQMVISFAPAPAPAAGSGKKKGGGNNNNGGGKKGGSNNKSNNSGGGRSNSGGGRRRK